MGLAATFFGPLTRPFLVLRKTTPLLAAVIGVERLLRIDFNANARPVSFVSLAVEGVKQKKTQWDSNGGALPGYGAPTGIVVNYAPDRAVRFDLAGVPQEAFAAVYRLEQVQLLLKGRPIPAGVLPQVASGSTL